MTKKYVIIGFGIAGVTAADTIRSLDPEGQITIFNNEPYPFYFRPALSFYFKGAISENELSGKPDDWAVDNNIRVLSDKVVSVNTVEKTVAGENSHVEPYDKLLIATGATPFMLPWPGADLKGVFTYRTKMCAKMKVDYIRKRGVKNAVVVGGGILGIEMTENFHNLDIPVTVLLRECAILSLILDKAGSSIIRKQMEADGNRIICETEMVEILGADEQVNGVKLKSGEVIPAEMVMVAIGVRAENGFLEDSGIELERGVLVDESYRTSANDVFAAGDVAVRKMGDERIPCGTWLVAAEQGRAAGAKMAGDEQPVKENIFFNASHAYKSMYAVVGRYNAPEGNGVTHIAAKTENGKYAKVILDGAKVIGGTFIGDIAPAWNVINAIENDIELDPAVIEKGNVKEILSFMSSLPQLVF